MLQLQIEQLVLEKFHELRKTGFSQSSIEAAINTIEFSLRENNTGRFPRGIAMMLRSMNAWIYERDPYACVPLYAGVLCATICCATMFLSTTLLTIPMVLSLAVVLLWLA